MKNDDLENTIPIKVLSDIEDKPSPSDPNSVTREFKYKEIVDQNIDKEAEEQAEEALAEKNIMEAEKILDEEEKEREKEETSPKKKNKIKELIAKFNKLPKKKKIIIIVAGIIILLSIITAIVLLVIKSNKKEEEKEEEAPVIVDNFYYKDGKLYFLNEKGDEIGEYECENQDKELCYVGINDYYDDFDTDIILDEDENKKVERIPIYNDDYVFIHDNDDQNSTELILYSIDQKEKIDTYNNSKAYDDNLVIVSDDKDKYGLIKIDKDIDEIIKPTYEYLGKLDKEKNLVAKKGNGYVIINEQSKELSSIISSNNEIKSYTDSLIITKSNNRYNVYDYKNNLIADSADFITAKDKYAALVFGNKLYIKDSSKNKYNEDGIELKNNEYVRKFIYNENGKLKDTKVSFTIEVNNNSIEIAIYDSNYKDPNYTKINTLIASINQKYEYLNYFNDKLYFYSDANKEKLIGSYTCNNQNNLNSSDAKLDSCYPANDTIYDDNETTTDSEKNRKTTIPLINNKYVFINDGGSTVNLIDLVNDKTIGTYSSVNTYLPNNDYKFGTYNGDINFIAVNKKGKYGMVNLSGGNASSIHPFEYNKMEKLGNYIIAQNTDNKWQVLFSKDSSSKGVDGKIAEVSGDRKYLRVSSSNNYQIYNVDGNKISNDSYKKIKFYNNFYGGLTSNNELYIYDYDGNKITKEPVKVSNTDCSIGDLFNIELSFNYKIFLCENGSYKTYTPRTSDEKTNLDTEEE